MARALLGWSVDELARRAAVGSATVNRFEAGHREPISATVAAMERAFHAAGAVFSESRDGSGGVSKRQFRAGDIVRLRPQSSMRPGLESDTGWITAVEPHPPETGPTYRVWVELSGGKVLPGVFEFEFELVTAVAENEESSMTGPSSPTADAMQAYRDRQMAAQQRDADEERARQAEAARQMENRLSWGSVSHPHSTAEMILQAIARFGDEIARAGSPILFRFPPQADKYTVGFELHESGQLRTLATLRFSMNDAGQVIASTVFPGRYDPFRRHDR